MSTSSSASLSCFWSVAVQLLDVQSFCRPVGVFIYHGQPPSLLLLLCVVDADAAATASRSSGHVCRELNRIRNEMKRNVHDTEEDWGWQCTEAMELHIGNGRIVGKRNYFVVDEDAEGVFAVRWG